MYPQDLYDLIHLQGYSYNACGDIIISNIESGIDIIIQR